MTNLPFVTIGIPVYNEEKFVAETILSAINQTYKNIKIVISDNCSTDRSYEIIQSHVLRLANVKIIKQGKNIGAVNNFAYVLEHSDTEYFCWLGGHDVMRPTFIEKTVDAFQINKGISLVYPKTELIDENSKVLNVPTDSDIDTTLLDNIKGPIKVVRNLQYCTAVHGVFKTTLLKSYTIKEIIGADHIILYHAAIHGKLYPLQEIMYLRREIRKGDLDDQIKRYGDYGMKTKSEINPFQELCKEYLRYTLFEKKIGLKRRIILFIKVSDILRKRFNSPYYHFITDALLFITRTKNKYL